MKTVKRSFSLFLLSSMFLAASAQANQAAGEERIFSNQADACLRIMEKTAQEMSVQGVALMAYIPGDTTNTWISKCAWSEH